MFGSDKIIDEFPGRKIYVERNDGPELENILVYEMNDDHDAVRVVVARRGELQTDRENNQLLLHLFHTRFEQRDDKQPSDLTKITRATADETTFPISLEELYEKNKKRKGLSSMTVSELHTRLNEEHALAASKEDRKRQASADSAARTEVSKRFSFSLASLAFALMGVPLAITAHRKETSIGFLLSLVIAFVYFFFIILADTVRNNPALHPEWLIWTPNVLFIALGAWLFLRLSRM
jgi:lipopolysaccharide export system permease protein